MTKKQCAKLTYGYTSDENNERTALLPAKSTRMSELEVLLTWLLTGLPKQLFRDFEKSSFHRVNCLTI